MDRARHKRNYDLHSWTGLALGLFIYLVAFTGCFALFDAELQAWEDPAARIVHDGPLAPIDPVFRDWIDANQGPGDEVGFARLTFPSALEPYYAGFVEIEIHREDGGHDHVFHEQRWRPDTAEPLAERGEGVSHWLLELHRKLMWPDSLGGGTVGRALVGAAGVILLLSIVSGVVAHTKLTRELFSLRVFRSTRLRWQDAHKVIGLWALPFHTMIALTGAVIGVVTLLAPAIAMLTFKGDQEALIEAVLGAPVQPAGVQAEMISLDSVAAMVHADSGAPAAFVSITNWNDANARFDVFFEPDTELAQVEGVQLDGVTGARIAGSPLEDISAAERVLNAMSPLHYGIYGGIALKFVYFALGLALAVITALGLMMWVERRLHGAVGDKPDWVYRTLGRISLGVTCGLPLATAAVFHADRLYAGPAEARLAVVGWTYGAAVLAALVYAFVRRNDYQATRELLAATGGLAVLLPAVNGAVTGDWLVPTLFMADRPDAAVDLAALLLGLGLVAVAMKLPARRAEKPRPQDRVPAAAPSPAE